MILKYSETTIYAHKRAAKAIFCENSELFGLKNFRKKQCYRLRKMSDSGVKIVSKKLSRNDFKIFRNNYICTQEGSQGYFL